MPSEKTESTCLDENLELFPVLRISTVQFNAAFEIIGPHSANISRKSKLLSPKKTESKQCKFSVNRREKTTSRDRQTHIY